MSNKKLITGLLCLLLINMGYAQFIDIKTGSEGEDRIKVNMGGRIAFDGAAYFKDETPLGNGVTISDARLTSKAKYKKWDVKIDLGFNDKKVNTKDLHLRYTINKTSWVKLGYYGELLGLENWEGSAWHKFMVPAASTQAFGTSRQLGITYVKWSDKIYYSGGIFSDNDAVANTKGGNQGYAIMSKISYDFLNKNSNLIHLGVSGEYRIGNRNGVDQDNETKRVMNYNSTLNTRVEKKKPLDFTIDQVKNQTRLFMELLMTSGIAFVQGEYYNLHVNRKANYHNYNTGGFYIQSGVLLLGDKTYEYDLEERRLKRPKDKTLELLIQYDYVDLNDGVYTNEILKGGRMSDISAGLNYYINKYMGVKLNYSYIQLGENNNFGQKENINLLQGRIIVVF